MQVMIRQSDLRPSKGACWYFDNGPTIGCVLQVRDDNGAPLGHLVLQGASDPLDRLGKVQHGVSIITEDTCA